LIRTLNIIIILLIRLQIEFYIVEIFLTFYFLSKLYLIYFHKINL